MPKNPIVFTLDGRRCTCLLPEGKPKLALCTVRVGDGKADVLLAEDAPEVLFFSTEIDGGRVSPHGKRSPIWPVSRFRAAGKTT